MTLRRCLVALSSCWLGLACEFDSSGGGAGGVGTGDGGDVGTTTATGGTTGSPSTSAGTATGTSATGTTASSTSTGPSEGSTGEPGSTTGDVVDGSSGAPEGSSSSGAPEVTCNGAAIPMLPDADGPFMEISVDQVAFLDSGTNVTFVGPGESTTLGFDFQLASCECQGCIAQGMMGIIDGPWRACFYDGLPACNTAMGSAQMNVTAPSTPGFYEIAYWRTWEYGCEDDAGDPAPEQAVAGICVLAP